MFRYGATSVVPQRKVYTNNLFRLLNIIIKANLITGKSGLIVSYFSQVLVNPKSTKRLSNEHRKGQKKCIADIQQRYYVQSDYLPNDSAIPGSV